MPLEQNLILTQYFHSLFGHANFEGLKTLLRNCGEERDEEGVSKFCRRLETGGGLQLTQEALHAYDARIGEIEDELRRYRGDFKNLRYFQYLALLYTEIFLDRLTSNPEGFAAELTEFAASRPGIGDVQPFRPEGLRRLAFFMATGSGKTLLLHLNLRQIWHYLKNGAHPEGLVKRRDGRREFDQILLITPSAALSEQHRRELRESGLDAKLLIEDREGGDGRLWPRVKVVEIHKLAEDVSGDGVSVALDELGLANLVFVDEGHKGAGSEAQTWKNRQQALSRDGFLVEYSATFAQAIAGASRRTRNALLKEYGRCILFDYSYRHFFGDGYGKSFHVLNASNASEDRSDDMLLGGLLVFYQQKRCYDTNREALRPYNIEPPLWILLGTSVSRDKGRRADNTVAAREERADVARVLGFLKRFSEEPEWACSRIAACLDGQSGFELEGGGADLFSRPLKNLRRQFNAGQARELYQTVKRDVFHGTGGLEVWEIKNAAGEFGLRLSTVEGDQSPYFGVINIGDTHSFRKHIEQYLNIDAHPETQRGSLFTGIDTTDSRVNLLVGAKKFIEGWSSWRVSAMGLMNIGRGEGSQIMQLFGRGIRLKGRDMSLKRSGSDKAGDDQPPPGISALETLYVFGWNADYMSKFQNMIEAEELPRTYDLPLFRNANFPEREMYVPIPADKAAIDTRTFVYEDSRGGDVDLTARLTSFTGNIERRAPKALRAKGKRVHFNERKHLIDEGALYAKTLAWVKRRKMPNLFLSRKRFREILYSSTALVPAGDAENPGTLRAAAEHAVCDAVKRGFNQWRRLNMNNTMQPEELNVKEAMPEWRIQVPQHSELLKKVEELKATLTEDDGRDDTDLIPRLHLDCHLYNPLYRQIKETGGQETLNPYLPPALVESETDFITRLKKFWAECCKDTEYRDWELYVLRNLSPGGVALYGSEGMFLPDFILWLKNTDSGRVMVRFVEPHGMAHESGRIMRSKAECFKSLPRLSATAPFREKNIDMAGWFIATGDNLEEISFAGDRGWLELERDYCVLRPTDNYMPKLFEKDPWLS